MKAKLYFVNGFGNYSHEYGWDSGLDLCKSELATEEVVNDWNTWCDNDSCYEYLPTREENGNIKLVFENEHGGSRNVTFAVWATSANRARRYAQIKADKYYPAC